MRNIVFDTGKLTLGAFALAAAAPAVAAQETAARGSFDLKPIIDARARYETVEQGTLDADALTVRVRAGAEGTISRLSLLAEVEGTVAIVDGYSAFPFPLPGDEQWRPGHAVIADPENLELNRLQLRYGTDKAEMTLGRQRINLDDQRWVGSVGWRQNEQTFDAVRGEGRIGPLKGDLTYAVSQRTVFGQDAGPRTKLDGDFVFAGLGSAVGKFEGKLFAYRLDYDESFALANSSQTYGGIVSASVPVGAGQALALRASYARQSDYGRNPFDYAADYWSIEGAGTVGGFAVTAGWEKLGSDNGRAMQTPMATLHKFNGWADLFLTTPPAGLEDAYVSVGRKFGGIWLLPGLNASVAFHQFDSDEGDVEYGTEWDAALGFKLGKVGLLVKYADYDAVGFGSDTRKLWLQAEWAF